MDAVDHELDESTTDCNALPAGPDGVYVDVEDAGFSGYCMELRVDGDVVALAPVDADATAWFPIETADEYHAKVYRHWGGDTGCLHVRSTSFAHNGTGQLAVMAAESGECV